MSHSIKNAPNPRQLMVALLAATLLLITIILSSSPQAAAQDDATPEAATPVATTPEEARFARLGGSLDDVLAEYGTPDWTDESLVGYNAIVLGGVDTITMVFYDAEERVRSYLLVYLEKPAELDDPDAVAAVVADVSPRDSECDDKPLEESGLGDEVYACRSESLKGIYSAEEMLAFEAVGEDGSFSYAVDPTDDQFYEVAVRFGTDTPPRPPTPVPTEVPTPRPPLTETYPLVPDIVALAAGDYDQGEPVSFSGTVLDLVPTDIGMFMTVQVIAAGGSAVNVAVESQDDLIGIVPGSVVTIFGIYTGADCDDTGACTPTVYVIEFE